MRHFIIALLAATTLGVGAAGAADISRRAPVAPMYSPAPVFSWTGFYIGANAGYGWASGSSTITIPEGGSLSGSGNLNGFIGGGQVGYNWQTGNVVLGLEADFQGSAEKKTTTIDCGVGCTLTETTGIDWFGTARGRIGYAFDRFMIYGTGGAAWTQVSDNVVLNAGGSSDNIVSLSGNNVGWTLGGGAEWMMVDHWSAKLEYLYIRTSNLTGTGTIPATLGGGTVTEAVTFNNSIARVGLNYHF